MASLFTLNGVVYPLLSFPSSFEHRLPLRLPHNYPFDHLTFPYTPVMLYSALIPISQWFSTFCDSRTTYQFFVSVTYPARSTGSNLRDSWSSLSVQKIFKLDVK